MSNRNRESELSQMKHFGRVLRMVWPHRRYVFIAFFAMIGVASAYTFSIATMFSVINILVEPEAIHDMVNLTVVQKRLDVTLAVRNVEGGRARDILGPKGIFINEKIRAKSPLAGGQVSEGDYLAGITTEGGEVRKGWEMISYLAALPEAKELQLAVYSPLDNATRDVKADYHRLKRGYGLLLKAMTYLPAEPKATGESQRKQHRMRLLMYILVVLVTMSIFGNVCRFIGEFYGEIVGARTLIDVRRAMYGKVMMLPMSFFVTRGVSDTMSRFMQDSQDILKALRTLFGKVLREPMKAAGVLVFALIIEPRLTLILIVIAPIAGLLFRKFGKWIRRANEKLLRAYGRLVGALESTLSGIRVVKAYTMENRERKRYFRVEREILTQALRIERVNAMSSPLLEVLGILAISGGMIWVTREIMEGRLMVSELFTLLIAMVAIMDPVRKLSNVYNDIQKANAAAKRVFEIIDMPTEFELSSGTRECAAPKSGIVFKDVTFRYPNSDHAAVDGVNLEIEAGKIYAVVGPNGSGKTTLISLLLRLFDPETGVISWDGADLREFRLRTLRRQISYVSQDAVIFADTVSNNIAYGNYDATLNQIMEAAKRAHAHEFIERLPDGYDTILGEHGTSLSGGERQRLAIARAILRNAPVLIFDEATSQIDAESERKIQEAIDEFLPGRTALIIAHRFSTIKKADRIVVMDRGRVVACGAHQQLIDSSPLYQTLYQTQLKGLQQGS